LGGVFVPGRDGTGPLGQGPLTGRGFGVCSGAVPAGYGMGLGRRSGFGRGLPYRTAAPVAGDRELLEMRRQVLQSRLDLVKKQLENLSEEDE